MPKRLISLLKKPIPRRNRPAIYTVSFFPMYIVWNGRPRLPRYEEVLIELDKGKFTGAG
jgi:hypothetical protein